MSNLVESEQIQQSDSNIAFKTSSNSAPTTINNRGKVLTSSAKIILQAPNAPTVLQASTSPPNLDPNLFTFKPKLTPKTELLTQNIMNFYERQNQHLKKQSDLVS
jgi:hypothetical protein